MSTRAFFLLVLVMTLLGVTACGSVTPMVGTAAPFTEPSPVMTDTVTPPTSILPTATRLVLHPLPSPFPSSMGTLVVEIVYTGQWYRETFNYQPDAANIRHIVLAMPVDSVITLASPGWAFSNLKFTPSPEPFAVREEAYEFIPLLDYLYAGRCRVH
jgi:hypothetical protein